LRKIFEPACELIFQQVNTLGWFPYLQGLLALLYLRLLPTLA